MTTVKERPILFKGEMVNAILEGRKTQTRRIIKTTGGSSTYTKEPKPASGKLVYRGGGAWDDSPNRTEPISKCPYGKIGDRLWVRETWGMEGHGTSGIHGHIEVCYRATDEKGVAPISIDVERDEYAKYRARWNCCPATTMPWKPSIHMPRWASRINLEITDIRVERLQDISRSDIEAEGCSNATNNDLFFPKLWKKVNGRESWNANPWVWVITFKVVR